MYHDPIPTRARKSRIHEATHRFVEKYSLKAGFSLLDLVDAMGGRVEYKSYGIGSRGNESIRIDAADDFTIYLPSDTSPLRDRFTMAHEMGHYFLHYPMVVKAHGPNAKMKANRFVDDNDQNLVRAEWEANWFAAALLMPEAEFRVMWNKHRDASCIAKIFSVTTHAAEVRAQTLDLT